MRLEYIATGSRDCPLVRLFEFEPVEAARLHAACIALAEGSLEIFAVDEQPWVTPINCRLHFARTARNRGLWMPRRNEPFIVQYNTEGWLEVADKSEGFTKDDPDMRNWLSRYNWLTMEGDVNLLISPSGAW
jgi:hypothetical protein